MPAPRSSSRIPSRHLASRLHDYLDQFPCVLLLGARQVGKSTFPAHKLEGWLRLDLERPADAERVASDVTLFVQDHPEWVWFDEAQRAGAEVDLVLERGGRLHPVEIKHGAEVGAMEIRGLRQFLRDHSGQAEAGIVIYRGRELRRIEKNIWLVPVEATCLPTRMHDPP